MLVRPEATHGVKCLFLMAHVQFSVATLVWESEVRRWVESSVELDSGTRLLYHTIVGQYFTFFFWARAL